MGQLSEIIADRFCLSLSPLWRQWFDHDAHLPGVPGRFRFPVDVRDLVHPQSQLIWSGLMLPDTLPLIGNGYGDWLCARITDRDELGELIHWYHGGGDWIPVGRTVAEALLHDAIDRYRPLRRQMLRGAAESIRSSAEPKPEADYSAFTAWLVSHLSADSSTSSIAHSLAELLQLAGDGGYRHALETLIAAGIAAEASTCDLIELLIHQELPDERDLPAKLRAAAWQQIAEACQRINAARQDLGWSFSLLGWHQLLSGQLSDALHTYFSGRLASAFSDQSVRLRLHRFDRRYGKFNVAQLAEFHQEIPEYIQEDEYLRLIFTSPLGGLVSNVQAYWQRLGTQAMQQGDYGAAYHHFVRSGWDLGVERLADARYILDQLAQAADAAGWRARAAIARAHREGI